MSAVIESDDYQHFGSVLATNMVAKDGNKVRFMYRENPDHSADSGWRFFAGNEDQDYADNPNNFAIYAVTTILKVDPSIAPYLNTPSPCCFERENENNGFVKNDAFAFEPEE